MATTDDVVMDLYADFIRLRQSGVNRDEAWYAVLEQADELQEKQVKRLLYMARNWEKREGYKFHYRTSTEHSTEVISPEAIEESVIKPIKPRPVSNPTTMLDPEVLKQIEQANSKEQIIRPIEKPSPSKNDPDTAELNPSPGAPGKQDERFFGADMHVLMYFKDFPQVLTIEIPSDNEIIVGRITPNTPMMPDVDLSPFRAGEYGISRMHAVFQRQGNSLTLTDLGSRNQTFLNHEPLHPHEVRIVKDGDLISFGRLLTLIHFA